MERRKFASDRFEASLRVSNSLRKAAGLSSGAPGTPEKRVAKTNSPPPLPDKMGIVLFEFLWVLGKGLVTVKCCAMVLIEGRADS